MIKRNFAIMVYLCATFFALGSTFAQIVNYEGDVFPENAGWERIVFTEIDRSFDAGWFVHFVDFANETDHYQRRIADFAGVPRFFVEWRVESDAPKSILDFSGTPCVVSVWGMTSAIYHTTITDSRVQFFRDTSIPLVFVDIEHDVAHTYRLELIGDESFTWYIDRTVVYAGIPLGPFPTESSVVLFATRRQMFDSTTRWDYVRYGVIPQDASGDFDTNEAVELFDFYYFHECLTNDRIGIHGGPDQTSGPGCQFTDFDGDSDVDLCDFAEFQNRFGDPN
ncbi:MAG: hypothetical protein AABZ47_04385 [Planctomycetota bacterium]